MRVTESPHQTEVARVKVCDNQGCEVADLLDAEWEHLIKLIARLKDVFAYFLQNKDVEEAEKIHGVDAMPERRRHESDTSREERWACAFLGQSLLHVVF